MVLVWGNLAKGNDGHTMLMVALNSLTMLVRICLETKGWFPAKANETDIGDGREPVAAES